MECYDLNQVTQLINAILIPITHSDWNGLPVDGVHIAMNIIPSHERMRNPVYLTSEYSVHLTLIQFLLPRSLIHFFTLQIGAVMIRNNIYTDSILRYIVRARTREQPNSRLVVGGPRDHQGQRIK